MRFITLYETDRQTDRQTDRLTAIKTVGLQTLMVRDFVNLHCVWKKVYIFGFQRYSGYSLQVECISCWCHFFDFTAKIIKIGYFRQNYWKSKRWTILRHAWCTFRCYGLLQMENATRASAGEHAQKRVFLWAVPRSISTAVFRAMMNKSRCKVNPSFAIVLLVSK